MSLWLWPDTCHVSQYAQVGNSSKHPIPKGEEIQTVNYQFRVIWDQEEEAGLLGAEEAWLRDLEQDDANIALHQESMWLVFHRQYFEIFCFGVNAVFANPNFSLISFLRLCSECGADLASLYHYI